MPLVRTQPFQSSYSPALRADLRLTPSTPQPSPTFQTGPKATLFFTVLSIIGGFLSTFWAFGYQRTSQRMQEYLDGAVVAKIKKQQVRLRRRRRLCGLCGAFSVAVSCVAAWWGQVTVLDMAPPHDRVQRTAYTPTQPTCTPPPKKTKVLESVATGTVINVAGLGATVLAIVSIVASLVNKTLANATADPTAPGFSPILPLDVFLVQAAANALLGHFLTLLCNLWLLNVVGEGRGLKFQVGGGGGGQRGGAQGSGAHELVYSMRGSSRLEIQPQPATFNPLPTPQRQQHIQKLRTAEEERMSSSFYKMAG